MLAMPLMYILTFLSIPLHEFVRVINLRAAASASGKFFFCSLEKVKFTRFNRNAMRFNSISARAREI